MLTRQQIAWAKQHDWFKGELGDGRIEVTDRWSQLHKDGSVTHHEQDLVWDKSFKALRDWAGY